MVVMFYLVLILWENVNIFGGIRLAFEQVIMAVLVH